MRTWLIAAAIVWQSYPPPFPRAGASKVLENERVVVWDVTWKAGVTTAMHEHRLDLLGVELVPGAVRIALPDGSTRLAEPGSLGEVTFGRKGLLHREEGVGEPGRRAIIVELKDEPVAPLNRPDGIALAWPREGAVKILDNDRVVVWDYEFRADREVPLHFHDKDTVVVELAPGVTRSAPQEGEPRETTWVGFTARFSPRGRLHREEHVSGAPRGIIVEIR